jgi:hypothetical protein
MHHVADRGRREVSAVYPFLVASMVLGHAPGAKASKVYVFNAAPHTTFQVRKNGLPAQTVTSSGAGSFHFEITTTVGDRLDFFPASTQPPAPPGGVSAAYESPSCVTARWTGGGNPAVTGYVVSFGTTSVARGHASSYEQSFDVGRATDHSVCELPSGIYYIAVQARNAEGLMSAYSNEYAVPVQTAGALLATPPLSLELEQNYPNPFNPNTKIPFVLEQSGRVVVRVFDVAGSHVATVFDGQLAEGRQSVDWDGRDVRGQSVASGVYLYTLSTGSRTLSKKMVLVK